MMPLHRLPATLVAALAAIAAAAPAAAAGCHDSAFVDLVAPAAWVDIAVSPAQGTAGVREALRRAQREHAQQPVRIRLAPGVYADNIGGEIYAQALHRSAAAPIWLRADDPTPQATRLMHGINLLGVSYLAIEGVTIGPPQVGAWNGSGHADPQPLQAAAGIHVAGAAVDARRNGAPGGVLDSAVYGRHAPSHHILVRRVTVQNLFERHERDGETSESQSMDGMKFNQVSDLWVLDSTVDQVTRHGIDNVGVHRAAFCRNLVARSGGGLGIEAKGGSVDVLYDSNTFYRVRRVELGGEETDAVYYLSADGRWDYEALRTVARNNLIVDARESALEFSGCSDCVAVGNTILFTAAYKPPGDADSVWGGDAIRLHDSRVLGATDGAGSDCQTWDEAAQDYLTVDPCWQVGSRSPAPVNRVLRNQRVTLVDNAFVSERPLFGEGGHAVVPCPLNHLDGEPGLVMNGNYWWNGGRALPTEGCSPLPEGAASRLPAAGAGAMPLRGGTIDVASHAAMAASLIDAATPVPGSPLRHGAAGHAAASLHDRLGGQRGSAVGAIDGGEADADRLFNWAEQTYPELFDAAATSWRIDGYYLRHYAGSGHHLGIDTLDPARPVLLHGPATGQTLLPLGPLSHWLPQARRAGH